MLLAGKIFHRNDMNASDFWTANMSFLNNAHVLQDSRVMTCNLVSTLASTISIVIGLLHIRVSDE